MERLIVAALGTLLPCSLALAFPMQFTHQGRLLDVSGEPLAGEHAIDAALYGQADGGVALWTETLTPTLNDGYYALVLGADSANPILTEWFTTQPALYLGVSATGGVDSSPRAQLVPVPFAVTAQNLVGGTVDAAQVSVNGDVVIGSDGKVDPAQVGSGTTSADLVFTGSVTIDGPLVSRGSLIASPGETTWTAFASGYPNTWRNICGNADYHPCGLVEAWVRLYSGGAQAVPAGTYWTTGSISREGDPGSTRGIVSSWWSGTPSGTDCASGHHYAQTVYRATESQFHAAGCRVDSSSYRMLCCLNY